MEPEFENDRFADIWETWQDDIIMCIDYGDDPEECAANIHDDEVNFNNADPSTHMRVYEMWEIEETIDAVKDWMHANKWYDERCSECLAVVEEESYISETQDHPYGDSWATETYTVGYTCDKCGHEEEF